MCLKKSWEYVRKVSSAILLPSSNLSYASPALHRRMNIRTVMKNLIPTFPVTTIFVSHTSRCVLLKNPWVRRKSRVGTPNLLWIVLSGCTGGTHPCPTIFPVSPLQPPLMYPTPSLRRRRRRLHEVVFYMLFVEQLKLW